MSALFTPFTAGKLSASNRIVMAPLTRNRAGDAGVPSELSVTYYSQRATAGLIVTEGTQPSAVGQGYANTPGIHSPAQIAGWRAVADGVHDLGGQIVIQLMHAGRIGHPDNKNGLELVAPSAIAAPGEIFTLAGTVPYPQPRALLAEELPGVISEYVHAARSAIEAGIDGVELHAANGYLLHQFLAPSSNIRTDAYGGTSLNRARFVIEVTRAVADAIGADRVGIRLSPAHNIQGALETNPADVAATYGGLIDALAGLDLAYLHILGDPRSELVQDLRSRFGGVFIANDGFASLTSKQSAAALVDEGLADAVAVGRLLLANPDLVRRWHDGAAVNQPDPETFYGGGAKGYIDYPALAG